uniref:Non-specific serine/threonine protein kinase n=1 Tax=Mesocestoides corti TaxID=53468 RepID=A0A5K3G189_MESCO
MLELWGIMISTFASAWRRDLDGDSSSDALSTLRYSRCVYIALVRTLFRFVSALWTPESCAYVLPTVTAFELSLALLDPHVLRPSADSTICGIDTDVGLAAYVRYLDPEINIHWRTLTGLRRAVRSAVDFMRGVVSLAESTRPALESLLNQAISGLEAVEFLSEKFVKKFVQFLAELPLQIDEDHCGALLTRGRHHFLMLLSHSSDAVRRAAYSQTHNILSTGISVDQAADPTAMNYKCITLLLSSEVLGEIVEFGLHDAVPEIASIAKDCMRVLLDAYQLIPDQLWRTFVQLLAATSCNHPVGCTRRATSTAWTPLEPLLAGLAPLANGCTDKDASTGANSSETLLAERVLAACLGLGGFEPSHPTSDTHAKDIRNSLLLLLLPLPTVRVKAAKQITRLLDAAFSFVSTADFSPLSRQPSLGSRRHVVDDVLELQSPEDVESTLCDLLIFSEAQPVSESSFGNLHRLTSGLAVPSSSHDDGGSTPVTALDSFNNALALVTSDTAEVDVRCTAGDRVLATLLSPDGLRCWHEADGPGVAIEWVSAMPSKLETLSKKLRIEPVIRTQLATLQFATTHDTETRAKLALAPSTLHSLLFVGLCFWRDEQIRHCVSHLIALLIFHPVIRESDKCSVCLPEVIALSYCLPFSCPVYSITSRHNVQHHQTRFAQLQAQLGLARSFLTKTTNADTRKSDEAGGTGQVPERTRLVAAGVLHSLRVMWNQVCGLSASTAEDALTLQRSVCS